MTEKYEIISKREYATVHPKGYVGVVRYTLIRRDGKKRAIIRFSNDLGVRIDELSFSLEELAADGNVLVSAENEYTVRVRLDAAISFEKEIEVDERCVAINVRVNKVRSGDSEYSLKDGETEVVLNANSVRNNNVPTSYLIPEKEMRNAGRWKLTVIAVVAILAILVINFLLAILPVGKYDAMHETKINNTESVFQSIDARAD